MSQFQVTDPYYVLQATRQRQQDAPRRDAEWRMTRDLAKSQRAARRAEQPVRDELVQGPSVPVGHVIKTWWRSALRSLRLAH